MFVICVKGAHTYHVLLQDLMKWLGIICLGPLVKNCVVHLHKEALQLAYFRGHKPPTKSTNTSKYTHPFPLLEQKQGPPSSADSSSSGKQMDQLKEAEVRVV